MSAWERALQGRGGGNAAVVAARNRDAQRRQAEARVAATNARARAETILPSNNLFASSGTGRDYRVEPMTAEESAARQKAFKTFVFGPERESVLPGKQQASLPERLVRDWGLSEQEFRLAGERAGEGRFGPAAGWAALGLAGAVPIVGDFAQGLARAGRASRLSSAASDAARTLPVVESISEPFPVARFDEILDRTAVQMDIPVEYVPSTVGDWQEMARGPSRSFGDKAPTVEAQIYRTPSGNWTYGSPHDVTIRTPLLGSGVGFRSRNPFEATGTSSLATGADDLMGDYISAVLAAQRAGVPTTDIDALLYLLREGNPAAGNLFEGIARSGPRVPFLNATTSPSLDDIVLVHSRKNPARMDSRGNVLLWPGGDFRTGTHIPEGSNYNTYLPWRTSLHFSQNARVSEAPLAGSWQGNPTYVLSRLNDVIEANPGSLGNLNPADTFFFPRPGQPLILPNARNVEVPRPPTGFNPNRRHPTRTVLLEDGRTVTVGGDAYEKTNDVYENLIDDILRQNVAEMGGIYAGRAGEDFPFTQRRLLSELSAAERIPLVGHARGSLPGDVEEAALDSFYRSGLGVQDDYFDLAFSNSTAQRGEWGGGARIDPTEFWRRFFVGNNLTGGVPIRPPLGDF